jgi:hypothetical protein
MSLDKYRSTSEFREILRILQKASSLQDNLMWQSAPQGRNLIPIHHFEIDFVAREVVIFYNTKQYRPDPKWPLYLKLDYRTSIFKIVEFRMGAESVSFTFPTEIQTRELRHALRHQLTTQREKYVILRPVAKGESTELKVRAQDVSPYGLGLVISEQNRSFIKNNRILWVTKLQDQVLPEALLGEVVYINSEVESKSPGKRIKELKVGLKLSEQIPQQALDTFIM